METPLLNLILIGTPGPFELILLTFMVGVFIVILPFVFYLITLQNILTQISPDNRKMPPGNVWLSFIPLFGLAWQFVIVSNLTSSLKSEFSLKGINIDSNSPGYGIGITYSILFCSSIIPVLGILTMIAGLICWIIYWVKISNYKLQLSERVAS